MTSIKKVWGSGMEGKPLVLPRRTRRRVTRPREPGGSCGGGVSAVVTVYPAMERIVVGRAGEHQGRGMFMNLRETWGGRRGSRIPMPMRISLSL